MSKYVVPGMRKALPKEEITSITEADFPMFPNVATQQKKSQSPSSDFKQKILNLIEQDKLDASERARLPETDPTKMSNASLYADGWAILNLRDPQLLTRFARSLQTDVWSVPCYVAPPVIKNTVPRRDQVVAEYDDGSDDDSESYVSE